jgi:hypothetical protein
MAKAVASRKCDTCGRRGFDGCLGVRLTPDIRLGTTTTCEQKIAGPLVGNVELIVERMAGLFPQFESENGLPIFFCRTIARFRNLRLCLLNTALGKVSM